MFNIPLKDSTTHLHTEQIQIDLEADTLTMYGSPNESVGCILRGTLRFSPSEYMKVKSITLKFTGKVKINGGADLPKHEYDLITHKWTFLEANHDSYLLAPKDYVYDFEVPLRGDLPESVDVNSGRIVYKLKAVVERPAFHFSLKCSRTVEMKRAPLPSTDDFLQPTMISGIWSDKFAYHISTPDTTYTVGDQFPVLFNFCSLIPCFKVCKINIYLREFVTYNIKGSKPIVKWYDLNKACNVYNDQTQHAWEGHLDLQVPKYTYCDSESSYIQVFHKLFVEIEVEENGELKTLHLMLRVGIQTALQNELCQSPPSYQSLASFQGIPPPPYPLSGAHNMMCV
ncbi:hypothetical protein K493DRAFT_282853 [Basidiobolus meristosporus CBS 931.73]|uniref:Arrestin C-terminal-like domain-containing protein n=1 Tax=Basidiobolus meristosporus CBS 931.73 TaxID=1314790 RepID=A0A1Y1YBT9_9FUNG|nr:hypothetical protein K493DRAFT_282853 [Basidiobolus meristosporus CBS 931.73]|eukprot:ORX95385.1 hypothetical protein K493DRAFT_282853 [Basidiobolus meristosporus CBS 931.73]